MKEILNVTPRVITKNLILIFENCGNTKKNKDKIRDMGYHYHTLKFNKIVSHKKGYCIF
jgi:hypothetical protein